MSYLRKSAAFMVAGVALFGAMIGFVGCNGNKEEEDAPGKKIAKSNSVPPSSGGDGKSIYTANNCKNCHSIGGEGGKMGPELTHIGAEADNTADKLADFVKNPKAKNPRSRMPAFEGKISDTDLKTLGAYLASLK